MRRLYYLAADLHTCELIERSLQEAGIGHGDFHVVSRDELGLYQHRIRAATAYQRLDVVRASERWALVGALVGLLIGLGIHVLQPGDWTVDGRSVVLIGLFGGLFGAWRGALLGLSRDSYKIARFGDDLSAGRHLVMVDVTERNRARVRQLMSVRFPSVTFAGRDTTLISPFAPRTA